jgi:L-lactate dehydrogenase complex protein LldG
LRALFVSALTAVGARAIEASNAEMATEKIAEVMRAAGLHSATIGAGITTDSASVAARLSRDGCQIGNIADGAPQTGLKQSLATIDAGIVEADYAIAPTGTLVMIGNPARPRSLSLVPPNNIVLLRCARILPDLAAVLHAVGPQTVAAHPMVMVTGPSRTADIEKRIVIGVHGPKELYVVIIAEDAAPTGSSIS